MSAEFFDEMVHFDEENFIEEFKGRRDQIFMEAISTIFSINKKGFINAFNLSYLSIPAEHSHLHNYWSYQILKTYLHES